MQGQHQVDCAAKSHHKGLSDAIMTMKPLVADAGFFVWCQPVNHMVPVSLLAIFKVKSHSSLLQKAS